ncbi:hypothetical protein MLD38_031478 [Melastoma candidum]|uniref:Uncharacterized protein n=1 Tax=Melastoma candidum TaxID=119954 RepID=A0ACB9MUL0_9MYRT|nr:hypothetical protein MLD38_031478 [Melastoma candidum]
MPVEMPRRLPFSVDKWTASSLRKRHRFLTHAHRDHSVGIFKYSSFPLYCTSLTRTLLLHQFPQRMLSKEDASNFRRCDVPVLRRVRGCDPNCRLDFVYLDCTFGKYYQSIPGKHLAIKQVVNCIWNHPNAPVVYLSCDLLGQEDILAKVSQTFGSKIYVDKAAHPQCHLALTLTFPDIISDDASSRFHLFGAFPRLQDRAQAMILEAQENSRPEPLIICPSTQWYACEVVYSKSDVKLRQRFDAAVKDQYGVWHVCYSIHSSRDELEWPYSFSCRSGWCRLRLIVGLWIWIM